MCPNMLGKLCINDLYYFHIISQYVNHILVAAKLQDASFDHIPSASRPSSPDTQLTLAGVKEKAGELSREEAEVYNKYIREELKEENIELMSKELLDRIK